MITRSDAEAAERAAAELAAAFSGRAEVYLKVGHSRSTGLDGPRRASTASRERGWAVRAGSDRASVFVAGNGGFPPTEWPRPDGGGLELPAPAPVRWHPPESLEAPLIAEGESVRLLEHLRAELVRELPGVELVDALVEDGAAEVLVTNSLGVRVGYRLRATQLRARAQLGRSEASVHVAALEPRGLDAAALARRLADRLVVLEHGRSPEADRAEVLLAGEVGAAILEALSEHLVGSPGRRLLRRLEDRRGFAAAAGVTLVDDGGLATGFLSAPVDGEGVPTRAITLVEEGRSRQSLRPWWDEGPGEISGCSLRASWRDLPQAGATHLFLVPDHDCPVSALLAEVARGYYFIDAVSTCRIHSGEDRFEVDVIGFRVVEGRPATPVRGARLRGSLRALLHGIRGVGRDLRLMPRGRAVFGAPTLLVTGLEVLSS